MKELEKIISGKATELNGTQEHKNRGRELNKGNEEQKYKGRN